MQDASSHASPQDALPDDPAVLRELLLAQRQSLAELQRRAAEQDALLAAQRDALAALEVDRDRWRGECEAFQAWLEKLKRARFGRSSEQLDPKQRLFEFCDDPELLQAQADALTEALEAAREALDERTRRRPVRPRREPTREFPDYLPRIVETIEPPAAELTCPTHGAKQLIGYDETSTLEVIPPKLQVRVRRFAKYVCVRQAECGVAQAARPPALVAGNRYDLSVAIQVLLSKYAYHLPLYRQQDLFAACGWTPSRSTLNNLLDALDELSLPLVAALREEALAGGLFGCDDTTVTLITPPFAPPVAANMPRSQRTHDVIAGAIEAGRTSITARMWAYRSLTAPLNYFDFTVSRHRDGPTEVLAGRSGTLLGDCYAGFEALVLTSDLRLARAACWAHVRRKFFALETKHPLAAARMLALIGQLYDLEDRAKRLSPEERRALRAAEAPPVLERIREFLFGKVYEDAPPKSELRTALNYARNNWAELQTYLTDGRLPIDNNDVEQLMKQVAVGRKNWLFVGTVAAGERAARLISLVSSALRNDLDVERYLTDVFDQLLRGSQDYRALLPHVWRQSHPEAIREYRVEERRDASERQRHRREERRQQQPLPADFTPQQQADILRRAKAKLLADRAARAAGHRPNKPPRKPKGG